MHEPLKNGGVPLLTGQSASANTFPPGKCIHEWFEVQVAKTPNQTVLAFEDQHLTYRELNERANQLAHHLRQLGVKPETLVGLFVERSLDLVVGLLGILKAGGAYVPMDPQYPQARLEFIMQDAGAKIVVTQKNLAEQHPIPNAKLVCLDADWATIASEPKNNPANFTQPENLAYVIYTSGSTGTPKGSLITHHNVVRLFQATENWFHFNQDDVWTLFHSSAFDFSVWEIWGALLYGGRLVVVPFHASRSPEIFRRLLVAEKVTVLNQTPSAFRQLLHADELAPATEKISLRYIIFGGEALDFKSLKPWFDRHGDRQPQLVNMYGITETTVHVTYRPIRATDTDSRSVIGVPIPDLQIYLLDENRQPVAVGAAGEICVGGAGVGRGYFNRPDLTANKFIPDPFSAVPENLLYCSGDSGRHLPNGDLEYLGRIDQQVKIRGFRIELGEIESVLNTHAGIRASVVVARDNQLGEQQLVAYVVPKGKVSTVTELREYLLQRLPDYMVPAVFVTRDSLPLTAHGKVDRKALPAPGARLGSGTEFVAPQNPTEAKLAALWCELLGLPHVSTRDNFFALGGHSLLAVRLVFRIQEAFGVSLPVKRVSECPTVAELGAALTKQAPVKNISIPRRPRTQTHEPLRYPASFSQEQLWFIDQLEPDSAVYNVPLALRLKGLLEQTRLTQSLNRVIARHEALRTVFVAEQGVPVQVVLPELKLPLAVTDLTRRPDPEAEAQRLMLQSAGKPFDLQRGPLVRAELFTLGEDDQILLLTIHHIVFDGWSIDVLLKDLAAGYAGEKLLPAPLQYGDFAAWQRQHLTPAQVEQHLAYWREHLAGVPTVLELPTDQPRTTGSQRGAQHYFALPAELTSQLRHLAQRHNTTTFTTLLAAFQTLLHRYSNQEQILVGVPFGGRASSEIENVIGFFVNTLPVKADFHGNPKFTELLEKLRDEIWAVQAQQDLPFERLVRELQPNRKTTRNPLFQVCVVPEVVPLETRAMGALMVETKEITPADAMFDLTLSLTDKGDNFDCALRYNANLFDATTVARLAESFQILLNALVSNPDCPICNLDLLPAGERSLLLGEWSGGAGDYPRGAGLSDLFAGQVKLRPGAVALSWVGGQLSYGELNERANQLAHHLRSLGVGLETPVGVLLSRSVAYVVSVLAVLKAGGAYVPLDLEYPAERLKFMLSDSGCKVVITSRDFKLAGVMELNLVSAAAVIAACPKTNPDLLISAEALAYVIYTSGSTGTPKGVAVPQRGVVRLVRGQSYFDSSQRFLLLAATAFDASTFELWAPLLNGGVCVLYPEALADYAHLEKVIREQNVTCLWLTAGLFNQIIDVRPSALQTVKQVLAGGEALSVTHVRKAQKLLPHLRLTNGYGPTECTTFACTYDLPPNFTGGSVPIGKPIANTTCYVLDPQLQPVPLGVPGELYLGGDGLARGYLNRPELTAEKFITSPFHAQQRLYQTGDRVRWRADGTLEFLGRLDNQIKLRGFRIELGEIESVLNTHAGIRASVVVARDNQLGEQQLVAYVVPKGKVSTVTELREYLLQRLPDYMVPAVFVTRDSLPLTAHGKVDRKALPAPGARLGSGTEFVAPQNPTEAKLAALWCELLGLPHVSTRDNFFALGGHSLLAVRLVFRIQEAFGVSLPVKRVSECPTVAELGAALTKQAPVKNISIPRRPRTQTHEPLRYPASFSQEQLWFIDQLEPDSAVYNVPLALRLKGLLEQTRLTQSLNRVIARHEALRTVFVAEQGVPVQVVLPELKLPLAVTDLTRRPDPEAEAQRLMLQSAGKPFDLQRGPLVRAELFTLGEDDQILLLTIHHIVFDGWSIDVLLKDLAAGYAGEKLLPAPLQYGDFAAWQRQHLTPAQVEQHLAYWREHLAGVPTVLELPTDQPRTTGSQRGAQHYFALPAELTSQLRHLAQRHNTTTFTTLLAAFQVLLHRCSGQQQILVGSPISGRSLTASENSIGFFVNMLPVKADFSANPAFAKLLRQIHQAIWETQNHQELPFEKLVAELQPQRDPNRNPIFQTAFIFEIATPLPPQISNLKLELEQVRTPTVKFDLTLTLAEKNGGLQGLWEYAAGTFEPETIARWCGYYETLLTSLIAKPDCSTSELDLLPAGERRLVLAGWNATSCDYPRGAGLSDLFAGQVKLRPGAVALSWVGGQLSYGELNERANQLAHHLRSLGVGLETPVGVLLSRSVAYVVSVLAVLKAGGAYVPLDLEYPAERLKFMLSDSGCKVVITSRDFKLAGVMELNLVSAAAVIAACPKTNPDLLISAEALAYVIYTSGSTGTPKGVAVPQRGVVRLVRGQSYFDSSQRFLLLAATAFDASTFELWAPLLNGGVCVLYPEALADYAHLEKVIREQNVTCLWLTAGLFNQIIDVRPSALQTVKQVLAGGEALSVTHVRKAQKLLPHLRLTNGYGPTECTTFACTYDLPPNFTGGSVPIGKPIANTTCYVLDPQLQPVPLGVPGELYLGGDGLARGYLNRPELTAEKFITSPFHAQQRLYQTGDRVRWRADGTLEFLGRLDNQIKLRGFRIELGEIESVLNTHAGIRASVVVARDNQLGEQQLVAYVVPKGKVSTVTELREYLLQRLPDYMVPAVFVTRDSLPLTAHGKVDRKALPAPGARLGSGTEFVAPQNPTEAKLAALWCELLGLPHVSTRDNFFALGGHSLLAVRLVNEIKRQMSFALPIRMVFQHPTIRELAKILPEQKNAERQPELLQLQPGTAGPELFFLIDEGSLGLLKLAHFLDKDLRLYASVVPIPETTLRAATQKDFAALPRMEDWAAKHVALIRSREITGPIRLAGHCFGGMLAFEVARQLQAAGIQVESVLLLDTWMTMPTFWGEKKAWAREHFGKLFRQGPGYLWRKSRRRIDIEKKELTSRFDLAFNDDFNLQIPWAIIARIYRHALDHYRPGPLASRGILFISQDDWMSNAFRPKDNSLGARRVFTGGVTVVDVPGNHVTVLHESHLPELAEHYNRHLKTSP